jgi:RecA/RadA recombinase
VTNVLALKEARDNNEVKLGTGCRLIDDFLRGGFPPGRLIEIFGDSRTGKTQLAFQLLLQSLLPPDKGGLGGTSLFVHCGKRLNEKRYSEMQAKFL